MNFCASARVIGALTLGALALGTAVLDGLLLVGVNCASVGLVSLGKIRVDAVLRWGWTLVVTGAGLGLDVLLGALAPDAGGLAGAALRLVVLAGVDAGALLRGGELGVLLREELLDEEELREELLDDEELLREDELPELVRDIIFPFRPKGSLSNTGVPV